jgi:anti-sigma regulatory factor (Ser/Thr protein kinase)
MKGHSPEPLEHQALVYGDVPELVDTAGPVLRASVTSGEHVAAIVDETVESGLRNRLGRAAEHIEFISPREVFSLPVQTMVATRRRDAQALTQHRRVTMLGQHQPWLLTSELAWWDAAFNLVLAELPITLLCACPAEAAAASRIVRHTHPWLCTGGEVVSNPQYRDPFAVLAEYPPGAPPALGPCDVSLSFRSNDELAELRRHVRRYGQAAGLGQDRIADLVVAVSELAANSIEHGGGHGTVEVWLGPGTLTVDVCDSGRIDHPLPGLRLPPATSHRGRGLWLGRELSDDMHVWCSETGTGVRVRVDDNEGWSAGMGF